MSFSVEERWSANDLPEGKSWVTFSPTRVVGIEGRHARIVEGEGEKGKLTSKWVSGDGRSWDSAWEREVGLSPSCGSIVGNEDVEFDGRCLLDRVGRLARDDSGPEGSVLAYKSPGRGWDLVRWTLSPLAD
jgi:hypothetical protein